MARLSRDQYKEAAQILGNISVAWFSIGVITPILTSDLNSQSRAIILLVSTGAGLIFAFIAIMISGNKK